MIEWDAGSKLFRSLSSEGSTTDMLVWDLVDERLGIHLFDDGTVVTRTPELITALKSADQGPLSEKYTTVPFGSAHHRRLFSNALTVFVDTLGSTGLLQKTVLLAPPWANRTDRDKPTPTSFGITAKEANAMVRPYLAMIHATGIPVITTSQATTTASEQHRWGLAPFHYSENVYARLLAAILRGGTNRD